MTDPFPTPVPGGTLRFGGRDVARIGYGAMQLGAHSAAPTAPADGGAVLRRALELGVTHIDTAEFYGAGSVNALIRRTLHPYPAELFIATKVGAEETPRGGLRPAQKPHQLRASVEANLRSLGVERIDLVNLRRVDAPPGIVATGDQLVDIDSQLAELMAMRDEGSIAAIGLSNVTTDQLREALPAGIAGVQNLYNAIDRDDEPLFALCRQHGLAWVPYCPLGSAVPNRAKVTDAPPVRAAAESLGATPAQVGLAWLLARAPEVLLIPGTSDVAHLEQNVAAGALTLDPGTIAAIDALG